MTNRVPAWEILCTLLFSGVEQKLPNGMLSQLRNPEVQTDLVGIANRYFSTVPLWSALCRHGLRDELDDGITEYLASFHALNSERNQRLRDQLQECIGALNRVSVKPMPLKGAAYLLGNLYPDPNERFLSDIDLMVPESDLEAASSALHELGFRPAEGEFDFSQHHHIPPLLRTLDDVAIELHSAPVARFAGASLSAEEVWANSSPVSSNGCRWVSASATDTVLLSFLHSEVVDRNLSRCIVDLRGFLDLRHLVARHGAEIDWQYNYARSAFCAADSTFCRYVHFYTRLTGDRVTNIPACRWRDRIWFGVCRSYIRWPSIQRWARVVERLSRRRLMERNAIGANPFVLNAYRGRELLKLVQSRLFGSN